jgi:hypothetical protein
MGVRGAATNGAVFPFGDEISELDRTAVHNIVLVLNANAFDSQW